MGTSAQGLCTLPGPAWLIQVSEAGKVEPGVQGPTEDWLPEANPLGPSPPMGLLFTDEEPQRPDSQVPKKRGRGQVAVPISLPPRHVLSPRQACGWTRHRGGECGFHRRMHVPLPTLPEGGASEPGLVPRAGPPVITLQPPSRRALSPQILCRAPPHRAGWWAHKTKPIWREVGASSRNTVNLRGSLFPTPGSTTATNNTQVQEDMPGVSGKGTPPPKHGRVWAGRGAGGRRPDTPVQASQAGRWPGLRPRQTGVVTGTPLSGAAA